MLLRGMVRAVLALMRLRWFRAATEWKPRILSPELVREGERCVACFLCAAACPTQCIELEAGPDKSGLRLRAPRQFSIDLGRCLHCGLCAQACPEAALEMTEVDRAVSTSRLAQRRELISPIR